MRRFTSGGVNSPFTIKILLSVFVLVIISLVCIYLFIVVQQKDYIVEHNHNNAQYHHNAFPKKIILKQDINDIYDKKIEQPSIIISTDNHLPLHTFSNEKVKNQQSNNINNKSNNKVNSKSKSDEDYFKTTNKIQIEVHASEDPIFKDFTKTPSLPMKETIKVRKPKPTKHIPIPPSLTLKPGFDRYEDMINPFNMTEPDIKYTLQCPYIDIVYTWVNGTDPFNIARRRQREKEKNIKPLPLNRVRDLMGLKYSLRSIKQHVPWVRKIFVITDEQYPIWFNQSNTDIQFIFHSEFFKNKSHVPTFNSNSIESNFYNLPDEVSDCFLYFNDDTFVSYDLPMETIWDKDRGQALYFTSWQAPQKDPNMIKQNSWHLAIHNTNLLLNSIWGNGTRSYNSHTAILYNKQLLKLIAKVFPNECTATSNNPFRTGNDVISAFIYSQFAHRYYNTMAQLTNRSDYYFALVDDVDKVKKAMDKIISQRPHTVCLNDEFGIPPNQEALNILKETFQTLFPNKPSWELDGFDDI